MYPPYEPQNRTPLEYIFGVIVVSILLIALVITFSDAIDKEYDFQQRVYSRERQ